MQTIPIRISQPGDCDMSSKTYSDVPHTASRPSTCTPGSYDRSALLSFASSPLAQAPSRLMNHFAPILDPANKDYLAKCFLDDRPPAADIDVQALAEDDVPARPIGIGGIVSHGLATASLTPRSLVGAGSIPMPIRSSLSHSLNPTARPFPISGASPTPSRVITPAALSAFACSLSASRKAPAPPASLSRQVHALPTKPMGGLPPVRPDKEAMALPTPMSLPHVAPLGPDWVSASRQRRDSGASVMSFASSASDSSGERPERLRFKEAMMKNAA